MRIRDISLIFIIVLCSINVSSIITVVPKYSNVNTQTQNNIINADLLDGRHGSYFLPLNDNRYNDTLLILNINNTLYYNILLINNTLYNKIANTNQSLYDMILNLNSTGYSINDTLYNNFVPYVGAIDNVNLSEKNISVKCILLDSGNILCNFSDLNFLNESALIYNVNTTAFNTFMLNSTGYLINTTLSDIINANTGNITIINNNLTFLSSYQPYWSNLNSMITSNGSINGGNVNVSGNLSARRNFLVSGGTAITDGLTSTGLLTITGINGVATSEAGSAITLTSGTGRSGVSGAAGLGGAISITTGTGGSSGNNIGQQGGAFSIRTGNGGTGGGGSSAGGFGGDLSIGTGTGATGGGGGAAGRGGDFSFTTGNGITGVSGGGRGGIFSITTGNGGGASGGGANGGDITFKSGQGGDAAGSGRGGNINLTSGQGGSTTSGGTGVGGTFALTSGKGGDNSGTGGGPGGTGGDFILSGGNGGSTASLNPVNGGNGGSAFLLAGAGGISTGTGSNGSAGIIGIAVNPTTGVAFGKVGIGNKTPVDFFQVGVSSTFDKNVNMSYDLKFTKGGNITTNYINATGRIDTLQNFSVNGVQGLTQIVQVANSTFNGNCSLTFTGGILTSTNCVP